MIDYAIRPATGKDVASIAAVHESAFPDSFLTSLGTRFLCWYYAEAVKDASGICLVADAGAIVGFVAGSTRPSDYYRRILRSGRSSMTLLATVVADPLRLTGVLQRYRWLRSERRVLVQAESELASLGISPDHRGYGIGRSLVKAFAEDVQARGLNLISLTTDLEHNAPVRGFYESLGFSQSTVFQRDRPMVQYVSTPELIL